MVDSYNTLVQRQTIVTDDLNNKQLLLFTFVRQYTAPLDKVYLTLCKVADTPFHIQGDELHPKHWSNLVLFLRQLSLVHICQWVKPFSDFSFK